MQKNLNNNNQTKISLGIVGARGYVGSELLGLLKKHPLIKTEWISLRQANDQAENEIKGAEGISIESLDPQQVADKGTDVVVLALPNGVAAPFVSALEKSNKTKLVIDLSADYRFTPDWIYSLPELNRHRLNPSALNLKDLDRSNPALIKISNPGCYATAMQLAVAPVKSMLTARPNCFGVSGYSGAGSKPSPNNDPENLRDNIIGYALIEHLHEKEVSTHLQKPVSFSPHVASFFRGINMTVQLEFETPQTAAGLLELFKNFYADEPLVVVQSAIPTVKQIVNTPHCYIGGFSVSTDGKRATVVSCLDNLLKGAASQGLQNINIAMGFEATLGLLPSL